MSRRRRAARALPRRLPESLSQAAPAHHHEAAEVVRRRRRVVAAVCLAGAGLLRASFSAQPGSRRFYGSTLAVAATWTAGGLASGPLPLGWTNGRGREPRRPFVAPVATGIGAFGLFYTAALVARRVPVLDDALTRALTFAEDGHDPLVLLTTLANGVGEEVFFRGALYTALPCGHAVAGSTAVYTLATAGTRNPALVLAAAAMGALFARQRRATGGLQAPLLTHLTWSGLMVRLLPRLSRGRRSVAAPARRG